MNSSSLVEKSKHMDMKWNETKKTKKKKTSRWHATQHTQKTVFFLFFFFMQVTFFLFVRSYTFFVVVLQVDSFLDFNTSLPIVLPSFFRYLFISVQFVRDYSWTVAAGATTATAVCVRDMTFWIFLTESPLTIIYHKGHNRTDCSLFFSVTVS